MASEVASDPKMINAAPAVPAVTVHAERAAAPDPDLVSDLRSSDAMAE